MDKDIDYWRELALSREKQLKTVLYEMAALIPDPLNVSETDWMKALTSGNEADAECLHRAWRAARGL